MLGTPSTKKIMHSWEYRVAQVGKATVQLRGITAAVEGCFSHSSRFKYLIPRRAEPNRRHTGNRDNGRYCIVSRKSSGSPL